MTTIIEIKALDNGGHRNLAGSFKNLDKKLRDCWAVIPEDIKTPNFPFGEVTAKEIDGVMTVTSWVAGEIPAAIEVEKPISETEQLRADVDYIAAMTGVEL